MLRFRLASFYRFGAYSLVVFASLGSVCLADSWDVRLCPGMERSCSCADDHTLIEQEFDLQSFESQSDAHGKTYRCAPSANLIKVISKPLSRNPGANDQLAATLPCRSSPLRSPPLQLNGKAPSLLQQQLGLPTMAVLPSMFPSGCGYSWKKFNARTFKEDIKNLLERSQISCTRRRQVNCTSATFLVFLNSLKILRDQGQVTEAQIAEWSNLQSAPWKLLNDLARPDLLMAHLKSATGAPLGTGKVLQGPEIGSVPDWPRPGDFLQFWRKDLSGHSVIFQGFLKDQTGKPIGACYWSANFPTDGYGYRCEPLDQIKNMIIGRLNLGKETP